MTAIEVSDVTKSYADTNAVDDLSLHVESGELFGFLGPNGAGKTTTIRMLTGQATPDSGSMSVLGVDPATDGTDVREHVGILPEKESPHDYQTAREYLEFTGLARDMDDNVVDERIEKWAERLSFEEKLDTYSTDLSRGQQQKVMIASAFLHEPELVFIDEPLANLDPIMQERVKRFLVEYVEDGNTLFLSTHHIEVAEQICTRVGVIDDGELVATRHTDDLADDEQLIDAFIEDVDAVDEWENASR